MSNESKAELIQQIRRCKLKPPTPLNSVQFSWQKKRPAPLHNGKPFLVDIIRQETWNSAFQGSDADKQDIHIQLIHNLPLFLQPSYIVSEAQQKLKNREAKITDNFGDLNTFYHHEEEYSFDWDTINDPVIGGRYGKALIDTVLEDCINRVVSHAGYIWDRADPKQTGRGIGVQSVTYQITRDKLNVHINYTVKVEKPLC